MTVFWNLTNLSYGIIDLAGSARTALCFNSLLCRRYYNSNCL